MPATEYVGKYSVHRSGRFKYRLYVCVRVSETNNAATGEPTDNYFDSYEEATIACYRLNGWGWPKFIDPVTRRLLNK